MDPLEKLNVTSESALVVDTSLTRFFATVVFVFLLLHLDPFFRFLALASTFTELSLTRGDSGIICLGSFSDIKVNFCEPLLLVSETYDLAAGEADRLVILEDDGEEAFELFFKNFELSI